MVRLAPPHGCGSSHTGCCRHGSSIGGRDCRPQRSGHLIKDPLALGHRGRFPCRARPAWVAGFFSLAGTQSTPLGVLPDPARLPALLVFSMASGGTTGLDILAAAASTTQAGSSTTQPPSRPTLSIPGPDNPTASLPLKVVKNILDLKFLEMAELKADIWVEEPPASDAGHAAWRQASSDRQKFGWSASPEWPCC